MKRISKKDLWLFLAQVVVWGIVILALPLATLLSTHDLASSKPSFFIAWGLFHGPLIVYFANFYIFGPYLFFRRKFWWFALCNILLLVAINNQFFFGYAMIKERVPDTIPGIPQDAAWTAFLMSILITLLMNIAIGAIAIGIRHFIRTNQIRQQLRDEKAKNTEAELAWLKNQINPHFLFNTLNNISSLTQIDPDAAQDAIAQLSDLLRYAMYETNKPTVPLQGEVEFMRNYIALMKLRVSSSTVVNAQSSVSNPQFEVAPLLFISLIENAFKHGVSSNQPSYIIIRLEQKEGMLEFDCRNSNHPKSDADRSGSGIGIENTRRRLDLLYPNHYTWQLGICDNGNTYFSHICIHSES